MKALHPGRPDPILNINFPITDNCNSQCAMCSVWEERSAGELSPEEISNIFSCDALTRVQHIGISGGEPTLRKDLPECVEAIIEAAPSMRSLSITSHGYHTSRWGRFLPKISAAARAKGIQLTVNISIDGIGALHDEVRGIKGGYERALSTIEMASSAGCRVQLQCTLSSLNAYGPIGVLQLAKEMGVDAIFRVATEIERLDNTAKVSDFDLTVDQKSYLADFFSSDDLLHFTDNPARRLYYREISNWLIDGGKRTFPCHYKTKGALITSQGGVYACSVSGYALGDFRGDIGGSFLTSRDAMDTRAKMIESSCESCIHDQSGEWSPLTLIVETLRQRPLVKDTLRISLKLAKACFWLADIFLSAVKSVVTSCKAVENHKITGDGSRQALLIGAYGGEHVGDAAILGGVIMRLVRDFGCTEVIVASFRPHRTARWISTIQTPVKTRVIDVRRLSLHEAIEESAMVVYAGGPLMELPLHLLQHFSVMFKAKFVFKRQVYVEGVGIGPLKTIVSKVLVQAILKTADRIVVRTARAQHAAEKWGGKKQIKNAGDPAFDYLETRGRGDRLGSKREFAFVDRLVSAQSIKKVGVNLRPLWGKYSDGKTDLNMTMQKALDSIAEGIESFSSSSADEVEVYLFSMNPDSFGFSDLLPALELHKRLGKYGITSHLWFEEPGVDSLLEFIKEMGIVLSMRFHGCIFALSQNGDNVIGLDYQVGGKGKIFELFDDRGASGSVINVADINSRKLAELMHEKWEHSRAPVNNRTIIARI